MSISIRSFSTFLHSPQFAVKEIALKEWAVCIQAIANGDQHILLRKGGITEETREFRLEDTSFYLYPTYEHQRKELLKPAYQDEVERLQREVQSSPEEVTISYIAHVVDDIQISSQDQLKKLSDYHVMTEEYAAERLRWKPNQPLHVLVVRLYEMDAPKTIPVRNEYLGCKSWIHLQEKFDGTGAKPILSDEEFSRVRLDVLSSLGIQPDH